MFKCTFIHRIKVQIDCMKQGRHIKSWGNTRKQGMWRYILKRGLPFGALMSFFNIISLSNIKDLKQGFINPYFFIVTTTFLGAFFIVSTVWRIKERAYQKSVAKTGQND